MKKERIFYLDFVRTIAVFLVLLTHYNARYLSYYMNPAMPQNAIISLYPFNIYVGNLGVSLFFIISGAALIGVYKKKCDLKNFYKKRFLSIYPMFWIAYIIAFLYLFFSIKQMYCAEVPKYNFIYTILGLDGYLNGVVPNYYILGDWFIGMILLLYLVFPLIRKQYLANSIRLYIIIILMYIPFAVYNWFPRFAPAKMLVVRIPEFVFGMIFLDKIKKVKPWMLFVSVVVLGLNMIIKPALPESIQTTYIGIAFFMVLAFSAEYVNCQMLRVICSSISKYSYAIFLTHHFIIDQICSRFMMNSLTRSARYMLFVLCVAVTALISWALYHFHSSIMNYLSTMFSKEENI